MCSGAGKSRLLYETSAGLSIRPFTVERTTEVDVPCPEDCSHVYLFAWLTRGDTVTARDYTEWKAGTGR